MPAIADARILILATDGFEDSELLEPRKRLIEAGADVVLAAPKSDEIVGDKGVRIAPDATLAAVDESGFDALLLPGGTKNPDKLRIIPDAVALVRAFAAAGKPIGAICHAPWLLAEADLIRGRTVTGWPSVRTDLSNAGAEVVDQPAVTDGNLVTSRKPEDIPAFTDAFIDLVEKAEALQPA
ncbi:type 1 glutamine amidotransferase domain-containing protein [Sphingosinicella sp. LHD-64]|uniref:type 1 glutamine amidotransferase domain-containing protein n=1 Tax=Sphingosinicella sp. LHD-64 TaxID=3072139 RepID=UPI00280D68A7|nr:type 1 glutamine amidotransferase domain-containing protein [Sphingosinicella sp. LHD-64]MDQ8757499.1 type 1 glutamine amidotransferase domain-containing protein [Sphingosinicella sp. LHD-64]